MPPKFREVDKDFLKTLKRYAIGRGTGVAPSLRSDTWNSYSREKITQRGLFKTHRPDRTDKEHDKQRSTVTSQTREDTYRTKQTTYSIN